MEGKFSGTATNNLISNDTKNNANMFDPFGSLGGGDGSNILGGWSNFSSGAPASNIPSQNSQAEQNSNDPFAEFGKKSLNFYCLQKFIYLLFVS